MISFGQNWFYFDRIVVLGKMGGIWAKLVVFGQHQLPLHLGKMGDILTKFGENSCILRKSLYLGTMDVFGLKRLHLGYVSCTWAIWLYLEKWFYLGKMVLYGQHACS